MNQTTLIVKLLEDPKQSFFEDDVCITEVLVEFTTKYKKTNQNSNIIQVSAWGEQAKVLALTSKGNFLIVEGFISLRPLYLESQETLIAQKIVELTVISFYPYFLFNESKINQEILSRLKQKNLSASKLDELPF